MDRMIAMCHDEVVKHLNKREIAIDMTVGRGNDTKLLCSKAKRVYGFDINSAAIVSTEFMLEANGYRNFVFYCDDHKDFDKYVFENPAVIMYQLGTFDNMKTINMTMAESTIESLEKALKIIKVGGVITILSSCQTDFAIEQSNKVLLYTKTINPKVYDVMFHSLINFKSAKPYLLIIKRKR